MRKINEMMFRRRQAVLLNKGEEVVLEDKYLATILKNIQIYGYTLSQKVIDALKTQPTDVAVGFYKDIVSIIQEAVGFKEDLTPMYPNFPEQVMEMEEVELYINAIIHYLSLGTAFPEYEKDVRFPLIEENTLKIIDVCSEDDVKSVFKNLLSSKVSLSNMDKNDITLILDTYDNINTLIPSLDITFKETLVFITEELRNRDNFCLADISPLYKTATDVLRLAVAMSNGDISLAKRTMFKKFKRSEKRFLLGLLEGAKNIEEDMVRNKTTWLRLGERLNPRSFKKFKKVNKAFYKLRNGIKIPTFNSKLEVAFLEKDTKKLLNLLMSRPGEFARNLDRLLRIDSSMKAVYSFGSIVDELPTAMLLQLRTYFLNRNKGQELRVFNPKGGEGSIYGIENKLAPLNESIRLAIVKICEDALIKAYEEKEDLGSVYIDKNLENINVPMSQRHASKSLKNLAKGSKIKIKGDTKVIRAFCYWKEPANERVDLDLSAMFLDENFKLVERIAYYELRSKNLNSCHSGDITSAPKGAIEYVDISVEDCIKNKVKYVAIVVNSFTSTPFADLPECYYGFMEREEPKMGEIFEPKTVEHKIDISCRKTQVLTSIIDLSNLEMICADIPVSTFELVNNVDYNKNQLILNIKSVLNANKPNLYDLFKLHAKARGNEVELLKANTIYCLNKEEFIENIEKSERTIYNILKKSRPSIVSKLHSYENALEELKLDNLNEREDIIENINSLKKTLETIDKDFKSSVDSRTFITPYESDIIMGEYI